MFSNEIRKGNEVRTGISGAARRRNDDDGKGKIPPTLLSKKPFNIFYIQLSAWKPCARVGFYLGGEERGKGVRRISARVETTRYTT